MALYLLSYDIPVDSNEDMRKDLKAFLESQKALHILQSAWLVPLGNESDAEALVSAASQHVDEDSRIFVCELFTDKRTKSWVNLMKSDSAVRGLLSERARV
jgi:CRISPR/Cas system-associated endoribonuclease Cas2